LSDHWLDQLMRGEAGEPPAHIRAFKFDTTLKVLRWAPGEVDCAWTLQPEHCTPLGFAFGGFLACVVDQVSVFTMESEAVDGMVHLTQDLRLTYFRPMRAGVTFKVEGRRLNRSRTGAAIEIGVRDPAGKLCCKALMLETLRPLSEFPALSAP
jgi:uncharacterized protein (TIGR00369 family)